MPREIRSEEKVVSPEVSPVEAPTVTVKHLPQPGKYKLMAFWLKQGKYFLYQVSNPRNVVAVAPDDVEFTVGEQEISADVLSKETSVSVFIPDHVANTIDAVRTFVLP